MNNCRLSDYGLFNVHRKICKGMMNEPINSIGAEKYLKGMICIGQLSVYLLAMQTSYLCVCY